MSRADKFDELDKKLHDRPSFDCGKTELNLYIQTQAARHAEIGIGKTMVLPSSTPLPNNRHSIRAFYTIAPGSIKKDLLPHNHAKKLPKYPVPIFLLAQMAVHLKHQGEGLGKITLIKALENLWEINSRMRAYAIVVDCIDKQAERFYTKYGFEILSLNNEKKRLFIPMGTMAQLFQ